MALVYFSVIFGILLFAGTFLGFFTMKKQTVSDKLVFFLFAAGFLVRLFAAAFSSGHYYDVACFSAWADRMWEVGPAHFYTPEIFTDYPPGYMYILYLIGGLRSLFKLSSDTAGGLILIKLPALLCDLGIGWILWKEARKKEDTLQALCLTAAFLFNPFVILNSAVWAQVDSVLTLFILWMVLSLVKQKWLPACLAFCFGIFIKPQMLLFAPILFIGFLDMFVLEAFSFRKLGKAFLQGIGSLLATILLCMPFGLDTIWNQYFSTVESYPYVTVNACNFWEIFYLNWVSQDAVFLGIPYKIYGYLFILLSVALVLFLSLRYQKNPAKYPFLAALLVLSIYMFSVRMHERYLYPGIILLLFAFLYHPSKTLFGCYSAFSLLHFGNAIYSLYLYDPQNFRSEEPLLRFLSVGFLITIIVLYIWGIRDFFAPEGTQKSSPGKTSSGKNKSKKASVQNRLFLPKIPQAKKFIPMPSKTASKLTRADWILMAVFTLLYSCFALYDLGDTAAPKSCYEMEYGSSISLSFSEAVPVTLSYYIAPWHQRNFSLQSTPLTVSAAPEAAATEVVWNPAAAITLENVFTWQDITLPSTGHRILLTLEDTQASILELVFKDANGTVLLPDNAADYPALFDEQALCPDRSSFRNSMYFDEIYHGRTAYEFLHGLTSYENTHPPLGKIFISLGVALFGMTPFGWRIVGTLFGIAMVPLLYVFGKRFTENTGAAALCCVLFTFDFMHFTQTRIATIDVYITFFVLLMYYFMYRYRQLSFYDTPLQKTFLPLGACGICMGLGIACKWTGVYAGAGLAVLFFSLLYRRYQEYCYAKANPRGESNGISHAFIINTFLPSAKKTILFCIGFFVVVPAVIYLLSYLPFRDYDGNGLFARMFQNQISMYQYHSTLDATHPYASSWYEWPIIKRPVWYYSSVVTGAYGSGGLREGISAFGNPLVWWLGIPAVFYILYLGIAKKDSNARFLLIGYLAQYVPWFFVTRITFIYHYFPSVGFVVLMIVYSLYQSTKKLPPRRFYALAAFYGIAVFALFLLFYPVLSGQPVEAAFVDKWLRWFPDWVLTAR